MRVTVQSRPGLAAGETQPAPPGARDASPQRTPAFPNARKPTSEGRLSRCGVPLRALGKSYVGDAGPASRCLFGWNEWFPLVPIRTSRAAWEIRVIFQG